MSGALIVMFVVWIVVGALAGWLVPLLAKSKPPYGLAADLIVSIVVMIVIGLGDWFIIPAMFPQFDGLIKFVAAILEPLTGVLIALWLMRWWKKRS
ncbi:MAG: hypothetical protein KKA73_30140 [Chloroflexi bacterium]|nr:hypothetical protein [Chloroflexota bacterium]MBU1751960.1 hypothetical protein [Chloroflexota bacterium]